MTTAAAVLEGHMHSIFNEGKWKSGLYVLRVNKWFGLDLHDYGLERLVNAASKKLVISINYTNTY